MIATYTIEHHMRFEYAEPARDSVMTLYVCPIRDRTQLLREFSVHTDPDGPLYEFIDSLGNTGHFLDRPRSHERLLITARSVVEVGPLVSAPERLNPGASDVLQRAVKTLELWPMVHPSHFAGWTPALEKFKAMHDLAPGDDPLVSTRDLCTELHRLLEYAPGETRYDSPIDRILETGRGVCQDYAHVMAAILRGWGIPCRYVSGYLGPPAGEVAKCESHAWVECWFPDIGWDRVRPHQRHRRRRAPHPGSGGEGLCRCPADPGHLSRGRGFDSQGRGGYRANQRDDFAHGRTSVLKIEQLCYAPRDKRYPIR